MPSDIQTVAAPQAKRYTPGPLSLSLAKGQADRMEALLAHMQRNGHANATARELCQAYERTYAEGETGGRMFPHTGMARMNNLEAAGRVVCDRDNKRICTVTGERVQVYSLPLQQVDWL